MRRERKDNSFERNADYLKKKREKQNETKNPHTGIRKEKPKVKQ